MPEEHPAADDPRNSNDELFSTTPHETGAWSHQSTDFTDDATSEAKECLPRPFGRFLLVELLGQGAFGSVYRANDEQLSRDVALKIPRVQTFLRPEDRQRFVREARAAAQLQHPNIVPVHEAGEWEGTCYIATDYVDGVTMRHALAGATSEDIDKSVHLIVRLAVALQHAHNRGIIHRDIKPENVMLDAEGQPHIMDFGLARREQADELRTTEGTRIGTPAYMSPEQAKGESHLADARSDLWALGVMLYELLTCKRPFAGKGLDILNRILQVDPIPPRQHDKSIPKDLETICLKCLCKDPEGRYPSCQHLADDLQRWLQYEPIEARPLSWPSRIWRTCCRNPLIASLTAVSVLFFLLALGVGIVAFARTSLALKRERSALGEKTQALELKDQALKKAEAARQESERKRRQVLSQQLADQSRSLIQAELPLGLLLAAESVDLSLQAGEPTNAVAEHALWKGLFQATRRRLLHDKQLTTFTPAFTPDSRNLLGQFAAQGLNLWRLDEKTGDIPAQQFGEGLGRIARCHVSNDGQWLAVGFSGGAIKLYDLRSGSVGESALLRGHSYQISDLQFSPDSNWLASSDPRMEVRLWNLRSNLPGQGSKLSIPTTRSIGPQSYNRGVYHLRFTADGTHLAGTALRSVFVWRLTETKPSSASEYVLNSSPVSGLSSGTPHAATFSPDGQWLVGHSIERGVGTRLWKLGQGGRIATSSIDLGSVSDYTFGPKGCRLAVRSSTQSIRLWDLRQTNPASNAVELRGHRGAISTHAFSPDGRYLASAGSDGEIRLWSLTGEGPPKAIVFSGHQHSVERLAFHPDGRWLASAARNRTVLLWDLAAPSPEMSGLPLTPTPLPEGVRSQINSVTDLSFAPKGKWLAWAMRSYSGERTDSPVCLWRLSEKSSPVRIDLSRSSATAGVLFDASQTNLIERRDNIVRVWELDKLDPSVQPTPKRQVYGDVVTCTVLDPRGQLAVGRDNGTVTLSDWKDGDPRSATHVLEAHLSRVGAVAFGSKGLLVSADVKGNIALWRPPYESRETPLTISTEFLSNLGSLATSDDGRWLLVRSGSPTQRSSTDRWGLCDLTEEAPTFRGLSALTVEISSRSQWLAYTQQQKTGQRLILRDDPSSTTERVLVKSDNSLWFRFSPCERWLVAVSAKELMLWHLEGQEPQRIRVESVPSAINRIEFDPSGNWLAACSRGEKSVRLWNLTPKRPLVVRELNGHTQAVSALALSPDGRWLTTIANDGDLRLWHTDPKRLGESIVLSTGINYELQHLVFAPNGRWLFASDRYGRGSFVARVPTRSDRVEDLVEEVRRLAKRRLTPQERRLYLLETD